MHNKKSKAILAIPLILTGILFLADPEASITGAVTGIQHSTPGLNPIIGVLLIAMATTLILAKSEEEKQKEIDKAIDSVYKGSEAVAKSVRNLTEDQIMMISEALKTKRGFEKEGKAVDKYEQAKKILDAYTTSGKKTAKEFYGITEMDKAKEEMLFQDLYDTDTHEFLVKGMGNKFDLTDRIKAAISDEAQGKLVEKYQSKIYSGLNPELQTDMLKKIGADKYIDIKTMGKYAQNLPLTAQLVQVYDKGKGSLNENTVKNILGKTGTREYLKDKYRKAA